MNNNMSEFIACCSEYCKRKNECARYITNLKDGKTHQVENLYFYGFHAEGMTPETYIESYWCGERGNWGMFMDMEND